MREQDEGLNIIEQDVTRPARARTLQLLHPKDQPLA